MARLSGAPGERGSPVRTVAIINQKGGCGKTTTAINLAGAFARRGAGALLVDLDPQSHCAAGLAIPEQRVESDIADAMLAGPDRPVDDDRLVWRVARGLDLIPSRTRLAGLEARDGGLSDLPDRELRLKHALARYRDRYAACFIDCSPAIGLLTYNAMAAADCVLIPVETSYFSLKGAANQISTVRALARRVGSSVRVWIVPTIHESESTHASDLLGELRGRFEGQVAPVVIRRDSNVREAASFGQPVIDYAPSSIGAADYRALASWLAGTLGVEFAAPCEDDNEAPASQVSGFSATESIPSAVSVRASSVDPNELARRLATARPRSGLTNTLTPAEPAMGEHRAVSTIEELKPVASPTRTPQDASSEDGAVSRAEDLARRAIALSRRMHGLGATVELAPPAPSGYQTRMPASPTVRQLAGARVTTSGVLFIQPIELGSRIAVAGEFNNWSPDAHVLDRNPELGVHELCLALPPGRHAYRLVIDGAWAHDPNNPRREPNPFGESNSLIVVPSPGTQPTPRAIS